MLYEVITRVGNLRTDREQVALDAREDVDELGIGAAGAHQAEPGVQLVDLATRVDARVSLADPAVVIQGGLASYNFV